MELLEIKAETPKSVSVMFLPEGTLTIQGVSCDEDPKPLYQRLKDWVKEYISKPSEKTEIFVRLKYFNTSSARCLLELLELTTLLSESGKQLVITWYYEEGDEDMLDAIKTYEDLIHHSIVATPVASYSM